MLCLISDIVIILCESCVSDDFQPTFIGLLPYFYLFLRAITFIDYVRNSVHAIQVTLYYMLSNIISLRLIHRELTPLPSIINYNKQSVPQYSWYTVAADVPFLNRLCSFMVLI